MTISRLWIITIILFIGLFILQIFSYEKSIFQDSDSAMVYGLDLFSTVILVFISGTGLSIIVAFIPYKQKNFKEKFKLTFPLLTSVIILVLIISYGYLAYNKVNGTPLRPRMKYEDIKIPSNLDCSSVRSGKFETEELLFYREGDKQIQVNKKTGEKKIYIVKWLNNCEYTLTSAIDSSKKVEVKIINIKPDSYSCYVASDTYLGKDADFYKLKRVR